MVDTSQTPALGIMRLVPNRTAATLLPIMQQHLRLGTTVWSDEWAAYQRVQQLNVVAHYQLVNHSLNFVDPISGVHTQNVESYWNRVKTKFKRMKGVHEQMLSSYLDEFMWRQRHGRAASVALQVFVETLHCVVMSYTFILIVLSFKVAFVFCNRSCTFTLMCHGQPEALRLSPFYCVLCSSLLLYHYCCVGALHTSLVLYPWLTCTVS